jgi:hypothetical protein
VRKIVFTHSWEEIGKEIVDIWKRPHPRKGFKE